MGTPWDNDNWSGYDEGSVMNHLENFKTKQFLLIHGNADDNVHYQQSMMLARAMEQSDVMFYQLVRISASSNKTYFP
jgi:dipeptidyl aminopeptidase/acylaminoacyl peptidase